MQVNQALVDSHLPSVEGVRAWRNMGASTIERFLAYVVIKGFNT